VQHEIEPAQVNGDRLVRVLPSSVLHRVAVDGQLMGLPEQQVIAVFSA
jgi:hypothetical protein